jgi:hypothetical protein
MANQRESKLNNQKQTNMKNFLKLLIAAGAVMALTGQVYATSVLYITDGAGISNLQSSVTGTVTAQSINNDGWSIVVATGTASPPASGAGTAQLPLMVLSISANYAGNGTVGNPLNIYFASDSFGPSSVNFTANFGGQVSTGIGLPIAFSTWYASGSQLPTTANPIPAGAITLTSSDAISPSGGFYNNSSIGGPVNLASYSLGEDVTLNGSASGSFYSLNNVNLTPVPEPGSSALVALGIGAWAVVAKASSRKTRVRRI